MKINLLVRIRNKAFWLAVIPALLLVIQIVASLFGFELDLGDVGNKLLKLVDAVFILLAVLGIINDPTTYGLNDSKRAMGYTEPYKDKGE